MGRGSASGCSGGKYHGLVVDVSFDWKPAKCVEERGDMGELGKVEDQIWWQCSEYVAGV